MSNQYMRCPNYWFFSPLERKTFPSKKSESEVARSCLSLCEPMDCSQPGSSVHGIFPGKNTGVGFNFLIQGLLLIQGSNLGLPHCRQTLYHLNHQGIPFLPKVVPFCISTQSKGQRNETSALAIRRTICHLLPMAEVMGKGLSCLLCGSIYGLPEQPVWLTLSQGTHEVCGPYCS